MTRTSRLAAVAAVALALTACPESGDGKHDAGGAGCATVECGGACCASNQLCHAGACCTPVTCENKACGDDGCGSSCGSCGAGQRCGADYQCTTCTPASPADFCAANGRNCGSFTGTECGSDRTENCGTCASGDCVGNVCTCTPESVVDFCERMSAAGKVCGTVTGTDDCQESRTENCGAAACTGATPACDQATNACIAVCTPAATDALFCSSRGKDCGDFTAKECGVERTANCGGCLKTCAGNVCTSSPPVNDRCSGAIDLTGAAMPVTGTTVLATDDDRGSCTHPLDPINGGDVVYAFTVPGPGPMTATIDVTTPYLVIPAIYLRSDCADPASELRCTSTAVTPTEIVAERLPPGTYYLFVDSTQGDTYDFELTLALTTPVAVPGNDACGIAGASAAPLTFTGDVATVAADTTGATDDYRGGCWNWDWPHDGGDLVYAFTVPAGAGNRSVVATVTPVGNAYQPAVYLWKACDAAAAHNELSCGNADYWGREAKATIASATPGTTYFAIVDGVGSAGAFTLKLTLGAEIVLPDVCAKAQPLALDAAGHGSVEGDTSLAQDDAAGTCEATSGRDLVYEIDTTGLGERNVTATVDFGPAGSASVYLWSACGTSADEVACVHPYDPVATAVAKHLPEGKYYVWVDEHAGDEGAFTLTVDAVVPPPSKCPTATVIDLATGTGTATGSTSAQTSSTYSYCGGDKAKDLVYAFTLADPKSATITVTPNATTSPLYRPIVYLRSACDSEDIADEKGCAIGQPGQATTSTVKYLDPGTYYVWVDGDVDSTGAPTAGDFTLQVVLGTPVTPPSNDRCGTNGADAFVLTRGVAATLGSLDEANSDYGSALSPVCYADLAQWNAIGPELVYAFTPAVSAYFTIEVVPSAGWDVAVWYAENACGGKGAACVHAVDAAGDGGTETLVVAGSAGTAYYIHVEERVSGWFGGYPEDFTIAIK